jgi:hypothetical protein
MSEKSTVNETNPAPELSYLIDGGSALPRLAMEAAQKMAKKGAGGFTVIAGKGNRELMHIRFGPIESNTQYSILNTPCPLQPWQLV